MTDRCRRLVLARILPAVCMAVVVGCASRDKPPARPRPGEAARPAASPETPPDTLRGPAPFPPLPPRVAETGTAPACLLVPEPGSPIQTVALMDPVEPGHAPRPANASERLLFGQLYETLVRVDCDGRAKPALAASWRLAGDDRTWIVSLREHARFDDGTFVTAGAVLAAWSLPDGSALRPESQRLLAQATALDSRTLALVPRNAWGEDPLALAHTDLAVAVPDRGAAWPLGTRFAHVIGDTYETRVVVQARAAAAKAGATSVIRFEMASGRDGRDLLDRGVDLLITRDPSTLAYAAALPRFRRIPLAWQQTRVLLAPGRRTDTAAPPLDVRQALAVDAVRGEARGAEGPFWWVGHTCEGPDARAPRSSTTTGRIVYDVSDGASRDLAERLVALVRAPDPVSASVLDGLTGRASPPRAVGLAGDALATALRRGADAGYVLALERRPLDACATLDALIGAAPWLRTQTIVPLVDTRPQAIVAEGRAGASLDWDGTLLLAAPPAP